MPSIVYSMWTTLQELSMWLLFGTLLSGLLHKFLPTSFIKQQLQGYSGVLKAVFFGVPLPLCSCGVIPAGIGLQKNGSSPGATIGFLIATPQTGIDSILVSASFLGWPFAIFKVFAALLTGIVGGFCAEKFIDAPQHTDTNISCATSEPTWHDAWQHSVQIIRSIWKWLVVGIILSAILSIYVPDFHQYGQDNAIVATMGTLLISTPLYVCATASVPIAAALVHAGFPMGAALVFLMAGPATNVATIGAVKQELGTKATAIYLGTVIFFSLLLGIGFDFVLQDISILHHHQEHHTSIWNTVFAIILLGFFAYFSLEEIQKMTATSIPTTNTTKAFTVHGMNCGGCVSKLESAFNKVPGIQVVSISLEEKKAVVNTQLPDTQIIQIIQDSGFTVVNT